jgi:hypothetical protein
MSYVPAPPQPPAGQNQMRVLWGAMLISTAVYLAIVWATLHARSTADSLSPAMHAPPTIILGAVSIASYFAAFLAVSRMFRNRGERGVFALLVVRFALLEFICVCGLLAALMSQEWRVYLPFHVLALIGFTRTFPSTARVRELLER